MTHANRPDDSRWPLAISTLYDLKRQIAALEDPSFIGFSLPKVKASPAAVAAAEQRLWALPAELREWLLHGNGWPSFYFDLRLLDIDDLAPVSSLLVDDPVISSYFEFEALANDPANLIVAGSSEATPHRVFVVAGNDPVAPVGTTYWLDGDSNETYENFYEFFVSVLEMHRIYLQKLSRS